MVHVAGTVGKGSTVAMIASMLQGCGYAVGEYTSPHLIDIRERIAVNGQMIGRSEFTDLMRQAAAAAESAKIDPTFFELITAVAFKYFAEQAVDIAVIETGLGGRLDSHERDHARGERHHADRPRPHAAARSDAGGDRRERRRASSSAACPRSRSSRCPRSEAVLREAAEQIGAPLRVVNKDIEFSYRFGATPDLGPHTRVCLITRDEPVHASAGSPARRASGHQLRPGARGDRHAEGRRLRVPGDPAARRARPDRHARPHGAAADAIRGSSSTARTTPPPLAR